MEVGLWIKRKAKWETGSASCSPASPDQRIIYTVLECQPLFDSSDMTITEWVQIAQTIEVEGGSVGRAECGIGRAMGGAMGCGWGQKAGLGWKVGMGIRWILGGGYGVGGAKCGRVWRAGLLQNTGQVTMGS